MRVALDFYRILMVPHQVEADSLQSAYRERVGQELWRGFSPRALQSRRHLLNEAYNVLSDPTQRLDYDTHLKAVDPGLDLLPQQISGALIVLCELGDYEGTIAAAEAALTLDEGHKDYLLARAIALLATGRDLWQQRDYEGAATLLHRANDELMQHHSFPEMQAEIRSDLNRLRPYRILELLAREDINAPERQEGLSLLKALLDERMGIEGKGVDGSGLTMEDALRFIQKVRSHMTLTEQHDLFEVEADRPSLVAAYLAAYALMTRGYVEHRPLLLRRARGRLVKLVQRHDVYIEQAICTMLLGQPDEALRLMQLSRDENAAKTIKLLSGDRKDLLLGLCRYAEGWFQEDVFPEYRDLDGTDAELNAYFEDPQVQAYLEAMPTSAEEAEQLDRQSQELAESPEVTPNGITSAIPVIEPTVPPDSPSPAPPAIAAKQGAKTELNPIAPTLVAATSTVAAAVATRSAVAGSGTSSSNGLSNGASKGSSNGSYHANGVTELSHSNGKGFIPSPGFNGRTGTLASNGSTATLAASMRPASDFLPDSKVGRDLASTATTVESRRARRDDAWIPGWLWKVGGAAIVALLCLLIARNVSNRPVNEPVETAASDAPAPSAALPETATGTETGTAAVVPPATEPIDAPNAATTPNEPVVPEPTPEEKLVALLSATGPLSEEGALAAIQTWQDAKHAAMGSEYNTAALDRILADPMLANWTTRSQSNQQQGARLDYTLNDLKLEGVDAQGDDRASVVVEIDEVRDYYVGDTRYDEFSNASVYRVRYDLIRRDDGQWVVSSYILL